MLLYNDGHNNASIFEEMKPSFFLSFLFFFVFFCFCASVSPSALFATTAVAALLVAVVVALLALIFQDILQHTQVLFVATQSLPCHLVGLPITACVVRSSIL